MRLAMAGGINLKVSNMPADLQTDLVHQMSGLKYVDQSTIEAVIDEFFLKFDAADFSFPRELAETLGLMSDLLSPEIAARIRRQAGIAVSGDPWAKVVEVEVDALVPVIEAESSEIAAVILSKLSVAKAAEILGRLPGEKARRIAYSISLTGSIAPRIVARIGQTLADQLAVRPELAFSDGPVERVGAILNISPAATRDEVLNGLDEDDAGFAKEVRKSIFTFADIPARLDAVDVPKVLRDVDQVQLITAMAGADGTDELARDFILENMSKRMAEQLREESEAIGEVKKTDAEAAMTRVIIAIRDLEAAGEVKLSMTEFE